MYSQCYLSQCLHFNAFMFSPQGISFFSVSQNALLKDRQIDPWGSSLVRPSVSLIPTPEVSHQLLPVLPWWRHQMETFSALLAICAGNSPVTGEFPTKRPVTQNFDVFFDLRLNKRLSRQWWGWWYETPSRPLWRHRNIQCGLVIIRSIIF